MDEGASDEMSVDSVGEMHARREVMEDGKRYIIYYTFGGENDAEVKAENV